VVEEVSFLSLEVHPHEKMRIEPSEGQPLGIKEFSFCPLHPGLL